MTIEDLIMSEINRLNEELEDIEKGTKEYEAAVRRLDLLMDKAIDMGKFEVEQANKMQQMEEERKDRKVRNAIGIGGIVVPAALTIWGTLKSLKFEETGTVTTIMGRGFLNKLLPKK